MGMGFAGRGNENDRYRMVVEHVNGCARGGGNWKGRTRNRQNAEWPTTIAALIGSRDFIKSLALRQI
jgi:hypothetical protein